MGDPNVCPMSNLMFACDVGGPLKEGDVLEPIEPNLLLRKCPYNHLRHIPVSWIPDVGSKVLVAAEDVWFTSKPIELVMILALDWDEFLDYVSLNLINQMAPSWAECFRSEFGRQVSMLERWSLDESAQL